MARSVTDVRFSGPGGALMNMILFLGLVGVVGYYLSPWSPQPNELLVTSFEANPWLNGLILSVLFIGIVYNFWQADSLRPAMRWINSYATANDRERLRLPRPPRLLGAFARTVLKDNGRLTPATAQSALDSVGTRIDERREVGRYAANLLVFLGLLGTFWGLLQTVDEVADVIASLGADSAGDSAAGAVTALITNLNEPLAGMSTAFSSSLFGLGGSLILGFLDIQSGHVQNRFYSELEDWVSGETEANFGSTVATLDGDASFHETLKALNVAIQDLTTAQNRGTAGVREEIRALGRTLLEGDEPPADKS